MLIAALIYFAIDRQPLTHFVTLPSTESAPPPGPERLFPPPQPVSPSKSVRFSDFVGAQTCAPCHQQQFDAWSRSTHGQAGGVPGQVNIIGRFDGRPLQYRDARITPIREDSTSYFFHIERENFPVKRLRVDAVIGGGHMLGGGTQSYFSRFPDGTLRFLPFDFIRRENVWFSQRRDNRQWDPNLAELALNELSEWPPHRVLGTSRDFQNCQNCHGSQMLLEYDAPAKTYRTRFTELSINCESCHGPGKRHIQIVQEGNVQEQDDIGMDNLSSLGKEASLALCFACHAVKDEIAEGFLPGKPLAAHFALKLPILAESPYFPDGRIRQFAYQLNHIASDCYLNGSMTCVDCHDPHSQKYRTIDHRPLVGAFDNGQCTDCHASKAAAPEKHSHHKPDSPGNRCTACHMPYLQHQQLGNKLRFARSDHTIPIPRPVFDSSLGIENACQQCHRQMNIESLQRQTEAWYGKFKPHKRVVRTLVENKTYADRLEAAHDLLNLDSQHPLAQTEALSRFIRTFLSPDMPVIEAEVVSRLKALAESPDLDLKALALMGLHLAQGEREPVFAYLQEKLHALGENEVPVRRRWAIGIDFLGYTYSRRGDFAMAIRAHKKAIQVRPDDPVAWVNLGLAYGNRGDLQRAIQALDQAVALDSTYTIALKNLGYAYMQKGNVVAALAAYTRAVNIKPVDASPYMLLANTYQQLGRQDEARRTLALGLERLPEDESLLAALRALQRSDMGEAR